MTETKLLAAPLTKESIPELINTAGPCITLLLPPYRPGDRGETASALLKTDLQEASKTLAVRKVPEDLIAELLEPLRQFSHEEESLAGSGLSRVIFRSRGVLREFALPVPPAPVRGCTVGDCFWVRPALPSLAMPAHVYVLEITKKDAVLLACGASGVTRMDFPKGTPKTLEEALGFDPPDHELINRSSAGPSTGAMRGVQFGTGSGRETQPAHLHDFYRAVDRGVRELLHSSQARLILAGVDEDVNIYRPINTYRHLLGPAILGSPGVAMPPLQVLRQAYDIALLDIQRQAALEMAESKERLSPGRFSADLNAILLAAVEGRVSDLYLDENVQHLGTFDGKVFGVSANWHDEDLFNVAAVETLRRSGLVHSLPSHLMAGGSPIAAALRY